MDYPVEQHLVNPSQIEYLSDKLEELIHKIDLLSNVINKQTDTDTKSEGSFLKNLKILTEDDWLRYKKIFREIHPNYYSKIDLRYGNILSKAEMRMMILLKNNQNYSALSNILGISKESARVCIYRTRVKLNIKSNKEFLELINSIG